MKFTYDKKPDRGDVVAYIDGGGDLNIKAGGGTGNHYMWFNDGSCDSAYAQDVEWEPNTSTHKFHKGDSVTITF